MSTVSPVRWSHLKHMALSPAHYQQAVEAELYGGEATALMRIGSAVDAIVFGGPPPIVYESRRAGKAWEEFRDAHYGELILSLTEYGAAAPMADAIGRDAEAMELLDGDHFSSLKWSFLGRQCISHPDVTNKANRRVTDLKTSNSSHPGKFGRKALNMGYHSQLGFYGLACADALGFTPTDYYIVACESSAPYTVTKFRLTDRAIEAGQRLCHLWMERVKACEEASEWPGYCASIVDLDIDYDLELTFGDEETGIVAA